MSLYNMMFGQNPQSDVILAALGLTKMDVGRFRNAWVVAEEDGPVIRVHTRNGGGNREHWDGETERGETCGCTGCLMAFKIPKHPNYLHDQDDDFDSTYADIYYSLPEAYAAELAAIAEERFVEPGKKWQQLLAALSGAKQE